MSTAEDVAEALGCEVSIVVEYAADVARELERLRREVHGLRAEVLTMLQERGEGEWQARRCECGADDACAFARERDEAVAALESLEEMILELFPYRYDDGTDDEADPGECIGYAAEELARLQRENAAARSERDEARAEVERLRSEVTNFRGEMIAARAEEEATVEAADRLTVERDELKSEIGRRTDWYQQRFQALRTWVETYIRPVSEEAYERYWNIVANGSPAPHEQADWTLTMHGLTLRAEQTEHILGNLLARIHGDGGHHTDNVGTAQSVRDADEKVVAMQSLVHGDHVAELQQARRERDAAQKLVARMEFSCGCKAMRDLLSRVLGDDGPDLDAYLDGHVEVPSISRLAHERDEARAARDKLKEAVRLILEADGCDCPCDCPPDHRGPDCGELCLACRIEKAIRP